MASYAENVRTFSSCQQHFDNMCPPDPDEEFNQFEDEAEGFGDDLSDR